MARPVERILERLDAVRASGNGWSARCPAHSDTSNSLSVAEGDDDRALIHCFAGCSFADIIAALELDPADCFAPSGQGSLLPAAGATVQHSGCTLAAYAAAKALPLEFLSHCGLREDRYRGREAVLIPYLDASGDQVALRIRIGLDAKDRFRWENGSKPVLYGLNRIAEARAHGYVVLVEGESDAQTLWHHGYPAAALPGANLWDEARDAPELAEIRTIYVVIEPDSGGEAMLEWLGQSSIRGRVRLLRISNVKDVSELHLSARDGFKASFDRALQDAVPWTEHARVERELARRRAWHLCNELAREPDVLAPLVRDLEAAGLVGEQRLAKLAYLALTSRFFERPVSIVVKGPSSGGKSYVVQRVLEHFPTDAYYALTAMSERALVYGTEPLSHRFLVIYEAAGLEGEFATYLMRSLLSEGRLRYETVESTPAGLQPRTIVREGPTGLIITTTAISLHPENETRLLSLTVRDTTEQTSQIFLAIAREETGELDLGRWHALQAWLAAGDHDVVIPFAEQLAQLVPPVAVRLRRDFKTLLTLIRAHALLHQANRVRDKEGKILAGLDDYAAVRALVAEQIAEGVEATVAPSVRQTVEAVARLSAQHPEGVPLAPLRVELGNIDKSSASRRAKSALRAGYLKNLESQHGRPARYVLGDCLPTEIEIPRHQACSRPQSRPTVAVLQGRRRSQPAPRPPVMSRLRTWNLATRIARSNESGASSQTCSPRSNREPVWSMRRGLRQRQRVRRASRREARLYP